MIADFAPVLLCIIFICGSFLLFLDSFEMYVRRLKSYSKLKDTKEKKLKTDKISDYIEESLKIVFPNKTISYNLFLLLSIIIFLLTGLVFFQTLSFKALLPAFFSSFIPLILLKFALERIRNKGSREAEKLVAGLLNYYRSKHKNITEAMEMLVKDEGKGYETTRVMIFKLLVELRDTKNKAEIKRATENFAFGIKTNWSFMLSQCIYASAYEGIDVTESLTDIIEQLKIARTLEEERKRINAESTRMVQFLIPISYLGSVFISVAIMDVPLKKIINNQFLSAAGIGILSLIVFLFFINHLILNLAKNGKFDF